MFSKPLKGALSPSTSTPVREAQILPDIKDKSNPHLVENLMGATKSQLCQEAQQFQKVADT